MQKLVFFVGVAGTGKTTVAREVALRRPCAFIDRDTVGGRFVESILEMNNMDKNDRDSDFYKKNLRDLEYDTAKDICIENLSVGQDVFMISPFTAELKNEDWIKQVIADSNRTEKEVDVKVVVVTLDDMDTQRERIEERGTVRDSWKLNNWDSYETRVDFVPTINWDIPQDNVLIFDNTGDLTEEKVDRLMQFINR
ncbi:AAA family ATPase [Aquibacillus salsiterrae]|uniref:ATP-binding protein n=1 Tax=Aquibacillus salsiterrae TaxID=2950439 RepID=A0A9X3WBT0_9BACI|nr:AAA family ATPase [Aquibacillus salsiterrae]MDC3416792.1 ATP-binding protein [Aquibacillus salsiterrae]